MLRPLIAGLTMTTACAQPDATSRPAAAPATTAGAQPAASLDHARLEGYWSGDDHEVKFSGGEVSVTKRLECVHRPNSGCASGIGYATKWHGDSIRFGDTNYRMELAGDVLTFVGPARTLRLARWTPPRLDGTTWRGAHFTLRFTGDRYERRAGECEDDPDSAACKALQEHGTFTQGLWHLELVHDGVTDRYDLDWHDLAGDSFLLSLGDVDEQLNRQQLDRD